MTVSKIIFLACNKNPKLFRRDPSYIYRCENPGHALKAAGHKVEFSHFKRFNWLNQPDVVVFHRPSANTRLRLLIEWLKIRGVKVLAEFDDLVFDAKYSEFSPGVLNGILSLEKTRERYLAHQKILKLFNGFTVSTEPLREHLTALGLLQEITVLSNVPHYSWQQQFDHLPVTDIDWENPIITYLPGTRSHDRDFQVFADGLAAFLNDYPQVSLQVTGPLQFNLAANPAQIIRRDKVPFAEYHHHIAHGWVNLSPLENTPFTRCKSALKIIEAGYWGRPTVCAPLPDAERLINNGAIPVNSAEELYAELEKLLDPGYYQAYTQNLRQRVLKLAHIDQVAKQLSEFILHDK